MLSTDFLESSKKQFAYYKSLGDRSFEQLSSEQLFIAPNNQSNSIAIIVNHLHGNMLSRWTDFLTTDGEKESRKRDQEFETIIKDAPEMFSKWEQGWQVLFDALDQVDEQNIDTLVYIRNQGHSIVEAVQRQLCHYTYHVGQIVFYAKILKEDRAFSSLSIPKGGSMAYNKDKFSAPKSKTHFTEEYLNTEDKNG
jgi:uncharacterized damage-inducible protein DinB